MERESCVQIRQPCDACDGTGTRRAQAGTGHVTWSKKVACPACNGSGHTSRWIPLSELKALLER
jgi:DnaJ-class molecular chaperone